MAMTMPHSHPDRRLFPRYTLPHHVSLEAKISRGCEGLWSGRVINVSAHGLLIELTSKACRVMRVNDPISVKLQFPHDILWLPAVVKHCHARRMGIYFPPSSPSDDIFARRLVKTIRRATRQLARSKTALPANKSEIRRYEAHTKGSCEPPHHTVDRLITHTVKR
ncbi:MAG: PilZ domain-containing protein [Nitrospirae bacterium]|nr:MAG: PilZ domain-containing protein [Nitrospirota bacterium]